MSSKPPRRTFIKSSSAALMGGALASPIATFAHAGGGRSDLIRFALVGCGGRGTGAAAQIFNTKGYTRLVAVADAFPEKANGVDLAAFAEGHIQGYSVTSEIFANMAEAKRIVSAAWQRVFTLGQASLEEIAEACRQIEAAQAGGE